MSPLSTTRLLTVPRILLWGSVLILSAWLAVTSPLSPLALRRAETLLIAGRAVEAADLFERVAVFYPDPDVRVEAWMQAAMIWMVDRPDPHRARSCLLQVIESPHASDALRATAWERLALVLAGPLNQPSEASNAWKMAYDTAPDDPRSTLRLEAAARTMTEAGHPDDAYAMWDKVARHDPDRKAAVKLAQAQILLTKSRLGQAQQHFKAAVEAGDDSPLADLAREGKVAVEDRMERLKSTMIEFESRDIPLELKKRIEAAEKKPAAHEIEENPTEPEAAAPPP
jgi:tetratricopeptide (TPR) repeat protein